MPASSGHHSQKVPIRDSASSESDFDKMEEDAQRDVEERNALAKRIKERDKHNTRHIVSKSEAKAQSDASKRLKMDEDHKDDRKAMLGQLRHQSRKEYLSKRKEDKKLELEALVQDDETLFENERYFMFSKAGDNIIVI